MTKKMLFLALFTSILSNALPGQNLFKKNDIYLELGGNGILASINYERQLTNNPGIGIRLGVGFIPLAVNIPLSINYLIKINKETSFIDAGMGVTYLIAKKGNPRNLTQLNFVPSFGYRHHTKKNGMLRINFTPLVNKDFTYPSIGISFGKRF